ncbi:hypothetical protein H206_05347 [Candidatus Electrothrix aarhusensis]|uniref:Uncharacterized protein n=1 Tax=Candidatus Electrothrix aarhusensis TaxID=1859131 RepID=A0A444J4N3_9BACT|nr:hypothetical protein H206_05347 [Candidatus Electrothrix aarhusensis]
MLERLRRWRLFIFPMDSGKIFSLFSKRLKRFILTRLPIDSGSVIS